MANRVGNNIWAEWQLYTNNINVLCRDRRRRTAAYGIAVTVADRVVHYVGCWRYFMQNKRICGVMRRDIKLYSQARGYGARLRCLVFVNSLIKLNLSNIPIQTPLYYFPLLVLPGL